MAREGLSVIMYYQNLDGSHTYHLTTTKHFVIYGIQTLNLCPLIHLLYPHDHSALQIHDYLSIHYHGGLQCKRKHLIFVKKLFRTKNPPDPFFEAR